MEILPRQKWGSLLNNTMRIPIGPIVSMGSLWPCFFFMAHLIQRQIQFAWRHLHPRCDRQKARAITEIVTLWSEGWVGQGFSGFLVFCFVCCFVWLVTWLVFLFCCMCVRLVGCFFCLVFVFVCWFGLVGLLGWAVGSWMRKQQKLKGRFVGLPF